jgi:hypothetical protein
MHWHGGVTENRFSVSTHEKSGKISPKTDGGLATRTTVLATTASTATLKKLIISQAVARRGPKIVVAKHDAQTDAGGTTKRNLTVVESLCV